MNIDEPGITTNSSKPLISVVVPIYNSGETVLCLLESLKLQTLENFEAVLVNDGSTDNTQQIIEEYIAADHRFKLFNKSNSGVSSTRNYGLSAASGCWIAFADADDWLAPYALESFYNCTCGGADFAISNFYRVKDDICAEKGMNEIGTFSLTHFVKTMMMQPANFYYGALWNKLFKRSIINEYGIRFNTDMDYGEDHAFILEYLTHVDSVGATAKPTYYYVDTPGSLVHQAMNIVDIAKNKGELLGFYHGVCLKAGLTNSIADEVFVQSFLIAPATDGVVTPFDEKLGIAQVPPQALNIDPRFSFLRG